MLNIYIIWLNYKTGSGIPSVCLYTRISESENEKALLRQRSVPKKEEKVEEKNVLKKEGHKIIEEEKAQIGSVSLDNQ